MVHLGVYWLQRADDRLGSPPLE